MLKLTLILAGLIACISLFAQSDEINFAKYKKEIGIDFQGIFNGGLGTALVFKVRKPETGLIAVNEKTAYRFRINLNGDVPIGRTKVDTLTNSVLNFLDYNSDSFLAGFSVGLERQLNRKRIQYSYGLDLGYDYYDVTYVRYYRTSAQAGTTQDLRNEENSITNAVYVEPFFGFKYFILPEISISVETGLKVSFSSSHYSQTSQVIPDQEVETIQDLRQKEIGFYFDYLRALNLSYYF